MHYSNERRQFLKTAALAGLGIGLAPSSFSSILQSPVLKTGRVGIIGLDTSHCEAFTKVLNNPDTPAEYAGFPVTVAYPYGSRTIESSAKRIPAITENMKKLGVKIADSIDALLKEVDVVLLETNDGNLHLEQALQVIKARKPLFIDKPVAATFADTVAIFEAAKKNSVPLFSSSSLRFTPGLAETQKGNVVGKVTGADIYGPCEMEPSHSDFYWYGIHGIETLYTIMGTGCKHVVRTFEQNTDVVVGTWTDGRIGTFRGLRSGIKDYGGTVFGEKAIQKIPDYGGYEPLVKEIVQFFRTGKPPVTPEETIELYAFMEAAAESKRQGGKQITLASVMNKKNK